jgi:hypothetical protein
MHNRLDLMRAWLFLFVFSTEQSVSTLIEQHHEYLWESNSFERSVVERVIRFECSTEWCDICSRVGWGAGRQSARRESRSLRGSQCTTRDLNAGQAIYSATSLLRGKSKLTITYWTSLMWGELLRCSGHMAVEKLAPRDTTRQGTLGENIFRLGNLGNRSLRYALDRELRCCVQIRIPLRLHSCKR